MMLKNKQCAVCEGHYDPSMLVGIMDTYMCELCAKNMDTLMKEELGDDYRKNLPRSTTREVNDGKVVIKIHSPVHPQIELEPTTA